MTHRPRWTRPGEVTRDDATHPLPALLVHANRVVGAAVLFSRGGSADGYHVYGLEIESTGRFDQRPQACLLAPL